MAVKAKTRSAELYDTPFHSCPMSLAIWDHSATYHPTKVNTPQHNPGQTAQYSIYLPWRNESLSLPKRPSIFRDGLPAHRRSPIEALTQQ